MGKILPVILALIGTGAGVGAGFFLKPTEPEEAAVECIVPAEDAAIETAEAAEDGPAEGREYVKMNNQFVIPVVTTERIDALVVMSLSLEVETGSTQAVYAREPKLRDAFLQVMFDHANIGGFSGAFTDSNRLDVLRRSLVEAARAILGPTVSDVLITEIARQDS